jgi:Flp pilus assembly protein TadD
MGTTISRVFAGLVLSVFGASGASAQTAGNTAPTPANRPHVISVDFLRHPVTPKVRRLLLSAMAKMDSGDHAAAIGQLQDTLTKYPDSAPYVHSLLGVEYVRTDRFQAATSSLEQAALLLPHDAATHYNFGLALICAGDYGRATQEVRRAVELDPANPRMQARLNALLEHQRSLP